VKYKDTNPFLKLHPDEPWFFIRAQDAFAPASVRSYASMLSASGDMKGSKECFAIADKMTEWQKANPDKVKRPD